MLYWLWLHDCLNYYSRHTHDIMELFGGAEQVFNADDTELRTSGLFSAKEISNMSSRSLEKAKRIAGRCSDLDCGIITFEDDEYPDELKKIQDAPMLLFYRGNPGLTKRKGIAVVGTRAPTLLGKNTAFEFGYSLADSGYVVISGAAEGIDSQAHKGALQSGGSTIAVLGGGVNHKYLPKNRSLREEIAEQGLLLTEYPPDMEPSAYTFPRRNRIISGLSECTVVVEADLGSGSLITAASAREQGKPLYAVPGSIDSFSSRGTNTLIVEGAKAVLSYRDVINRLENRIKVEDDDEEEIDKYTIEGIRAKGKTEKARSMSAKPQKTQKAPKRSVKEQNAGNDMSKINENDGAKIENEEKDDNFLENMLTENALSVYHTISDTPVYIDAIVDAAGLDTSQVLSAAIELEMFGLVTQLPNGRYVRK